MHKPQQRSVGQTPKTKLQTSFNSTQKGRKKNSGSRTHQHFQTCIKIDPATDDNFKIPATNHFWTVQQKIWKIVPLITTSQGSPWLAYFLLLRLLQQKWFCINWYWAFDCLRFLSAIWISSFMSQFNNLGSSAGLTIKLHYNHIYISDAETLSFSIIKTTTPKGTHCWSAKC